MTFAPHFSNIVIGPITRGTTERQVAKATGYPVRLITISRDNAWIEVPNDGRSREYQDEAIQQCKEAGLIS